MIKTKVTATAKVKAKTRAKAKAKTRTKAKAKPASDDFSDWEKQQQEQESLARQSLRKSCQQLVKLGVDIVTIKYDGYSDSGIMEDPQAFQDAKPVALPGKLIDQLLEFAEWYLPGGWEINEGACGELVINVRDRRLSREHCWRHTEYEHDEEEILL